MLTKQRHREIIQALEEEEMVTLRHLVDALGVSESTIRRDLSELEKAGRLVRVHGGARRVDLNEVELSLEMKKTRRIKEKERIAQKAVKFIHSGQTLFIDAGTTTLALIPHLTSFASLTVVTNGIAQAEILTDLGIETILLGGTVKHGTKAIVGSSAEAALQNYYFDVAFIGMNGIDETFGLTTPSVEEAIIKKLAIRQSDKTCLLADQSKLGQRFFAKVAPIEDVTWISE
ncbi:DeoR/GlpR family DNA-binding transcription regulator [Dolosicoccus paucivorans]|uniref:DeoR/GlpR family DNA-binding transcription regulator n=1 Tax=Dolosicoccus paucivorans TaxID=84521 RepID=UPI00088519DF|nr:DeoR/GlpR family DNA-binding transcription regulator [Dolosicoccus paucivorans]SDI64950.1 transcriptional regulator, DeoR family [Dolosicoccus paucivorans]